LAAEEDGDKMLVEAHEPGGFLMNGDATLIRGSIFLFPRFVLNWRPDAVPDARESDFCILDTMFPKIDLLLWGIGENTLDLPQYDIIQNLRNRVGSVEIMDSANALATFNMLNLEDRNVVAAVHPL